MQFPPCLSRNSDHDADLGRNRDMQFSYFHQTGQARTTRSTLCLSFRFRLPAIEGCFLTAHSCSPCSPPFGRDFGFETGNSWAHHLLFLVEGGMLPARGMGGEYGLLPLVRGPTRQHRFGMRWARRRKRNEEQREARREVLARVRQLQSLITLRTIGCTQKTHSTMFS
ncbi:hypothetical protein GQ53DRAFT_319747 [Thozetella sp. PMI_491]|nr:hypothetical protein GQ53DRAFT_319747 [Thozetella sp. PMI_491]